ncbi:MAG: LCP family protein [Actinomycetota bacterium]
MSRRLRTEAVVGVVLLVIGLSVAWWQTRGNETAAVPPGASGAGGIGAHRLLSFAVTSKRNPLLAVIGTGPGGAPGAVEFPPGMTLIVPGEGETRTEAVAVLPATTIRVTLSNALGAWTDGYAVMSLDAFSALVDRAGGLQLELPEAVTLGAQVVGPGSIRMDGAQVAAYVSAPSSDPEARWLLVLSALLASPPPLQPGDLSATDDASAANAIWTSAAGADVELAPTQVVGGTTTIALQPDFDRLAQTMFGIAAPIPTLVQNGSGEPGIGQAVAERLVPAGFRIVLSGNAESFDHAVTQIAATGTEHAQDARRARRALGVGVVQVTPVPSGLADVTIVVGRDFKG